MSLENIEVKLELLDSKLDSALAAIRILTSTVELMRVSVKENGLEMDNLRLSIIALKRGDNGDGRKPLVSVEND